MSFLLFILFCPPVAVQAQTDTVVIREWVVPWASSRPRDPYIAPDGKVWFVGQHGDYAATLDPESGEFERFDLPEGSGPHNLVVDLDGSVWYAGNRQSHIGRLDPASGNIERIQMPDPLAVDPHTLVFDQAGDIWFTVQGGNFIGKLEKGSRDVTLLTSLTGGSRPYGITIDSEGRPWVALFGTNKLAWVDPESYQITEVVLPREGARPRRLEITTDDRVWYVDYFGGYLGVYEAKSGTFEEWLMPGGSGSRPYGMAVDAFDRLWFVETGSHPNRFLGFDPATEEFSPAAEIPSGAGSVRHMYYDSRTNRVWFGTDANTIGVALLTSVAVSIEAKAVPGTFSLSEPHPNPVTETLSIVLALTRPESVMLTVFDLSGRVRLHSVTSAVAGANRISLGVSSLPSGFYVVRLQSQTASASRSFVIAK